MDKIILAQNQPIVNYTVVEIPVTANGLSQIAIADQPMLKSYSGHKVVIKAIELITAKALTNAPVSGLALAARAELIKASLVLYCQGWEQEQYVPLLRLNGFQDADATTATTIPYVKDFQAFSNLNNVDWTKSRVQYSNGTVSASSSYAFLLGVQYLVFDNDGNEIRP